jgi:hypothetical protein
MHQLPPRTRRGVVGEIVRLLDAVTPAGDAPLASAVSLTRGVQRLALITDLLGDADALRREAKQRIIGGAEVQIVHIVSRRELEPEADAITAVDPETPSLRRGLGEGTRAGYDAAFARWRADMAAAWRAAGAAYDLVTDDESADRAVRHIVTPAVALAGVRA